MALGFGTGRHCISNMHPDFGWLRNEPFSGAGLPPTPISQLSVR